MGRLTSQLYLLSAWNRFAYYNTDGDAAPSESARAHWNGSDIAKHISYTFHDATYMERHRIELRKILDSVRVPKCIRECINAVYATETEVPSLSYLLEVLEIDYMDISALATPSDVCRHAQRVASLQAFEELARMVRSRNTETLLWGDPDMWSSNDEHVRDRRSALGSIRRPSIMDDEDRRCFDLNTPVDTRSDARRRCLHMMRTLRHFVVSELDMRPTPSSALDKPKGPHGDGDMRWSITMRGSVAMCNWSVNNAADPNQQEKTLAMRMMANGRECKTVEFSTDYHLNASALNFPLTDRSHVSTRRATMERLRYIHCIVWDVWLRYSDAPNPQVHDADRTLNIKQSPTFFYAIYCAAARAAFSCRTYRPRTISDVVDFIIGDLQKYGAHMRQMCDNVIQNVSGCIWDNMCNAEDESESETYHVQWDLSGMYVPLTFYMASRIMRGALSRCEDHLCARSRLDANNKVRYYDDASSSRTNSNGAVDMRRQRSDSCVATSPSVGTARRTTNSSGELRVSRYGPGHTEAQTHRLATQTDLATLAESPPSDVSFDYGSPGRTRAVTETRKASHGASKRVEMDAEMASEMLQRIKQVLTRFEEESMRRASDAVASALNKAGVHPTMRPTNSAIKRAINAESNNAVARKNNELGNGRMRRWLDYRKPKSENAMAYSSSTTASTGSSSSSSCQQRSKPIDIPPRPDKSSFLA